MSSQSLMSAPSTRLAHSSATTSRRTPRRTRLKRSLRSSTSFPILMFLQQADSGSHGRGITRSDALRCSPCQWMQVKSNGCMYDLKAGGRELRAYSRISSSTKHASADISACASAHFRRCFRRRISTRAWGSFRSLRIAKSNSATRCFTSSIYRPRNVDGACNPASYRGVRENPTGLNPFVRWLDTPFASTIGVIDQQFENHLERTTQ